MVEMGRAGISAECDVEASSSASSSGVWLSLKSEERESAGDQANEYSLFIVKLLLHEDLRT